MSRKPTPSLSTPPRVVQLQAILVTETSSPRRSRPPTAMSKHQANLETPGVESARLRKILMESLSMTTRVVSMRPNGTMMLFRYGFSHANRFPKTSPVDLPTQRPGVSQLRALLPLPVTSKLCSTNKGSRSRIPCVETGREMCGLLDLVLPKRKHASILFEIIHQPSQMPFGRSTVSKSIRITERHPRHPLLHLHHPRPPLSPLSPP